MASIFGIDLGTFKRVTRVSDSESTDATFAMLPTDPEALSKALDCIRPELVVFEPCTVAGRVALGGFTRARRSQAFPGLARPGAGASVARAGCPWLCRCRAEPEHRPSQ